MVFFDPRNVERNPQTEVVPMGVYVAQVEKVVKKQKDAASMGLMVFYNILTPHEHNGKTVMDYFNLMHFNPDAERIGKQSFALLLDALDMGKEPLKSETLLEGKLLKMSVGVKPHYKNNGEMQNHIMKYAPLNDVDQNNVKGYVKSDLSDEIPFEDPGVPVEAPF